MTRELRGSICVDSPGSVGLPAMCSIVKWDCDLVGLFLALFDLVLRRRDIRIPLAFVALGFTPIGCLTLAIFEILPRDQTAVAVAMPSFVAAIMLGIRLPRYGRAALLGYAISLAAVLSYDLTRAPWILTGQWKDLIPNIGSMLLDREEGHAVLGYSWRWLGNGGGMGLAFFMGYPLLSRLVEVRRAALLYGVMIWACLILTLLLAPRGQELLFAITPKTLVLSLVGHVVFGGAIGLLMHWTGSNARPYPVDEPALAGSPRGAVLVG